MTPDLAFVPVARDHAATVAVDGTTVIYDEIDHRMLVLNDSAGAIWSRCDGTQPVGDIATVLAEGHGADLDTVRLDALRTVVMLADLGLVADARKPADPG